MGNSRKNIVLIVSQNGDTHASLLTEVLHREHGIDSKVLNIGEFPLNMTGSFLCNNELRIRICDHEFSIDLSNIISVWWRRPERCQINSEVNAVEQDFLQAECDHFIQGVLWSLDCLWVNDPVRQTHAGRKIVQITYAREVGLNVPETLVTNDPLKARRFIEKITGPVVFKRTGTSPGPMTKTSFVTDSILERLHTIRNSPTTLQRFIKPRADLRIIWVDGDAWAIAGDMSSTNTPEDCRFDYSMEFSLHDLPSSVRNALGELMERLGLVWGAIDMRLGIDNEYYFLEVNPAGQFAYLEQLVNVPLMSALASLLARGKSRKCL